MPCQGMISRCALLLVVGVLTQPVVQGHAETYFATEFGVTSPNDLQDIDITTTGFSSLTQSDLDLDTSLLYGVRVGHYFDSARWLGLETQLFVTHPGIKQQAITLSGPGGSTTFPDVPGFNLRVITWTPLALSLRYPGKRLQPYLGGGPAFFFARLKDKVTGDVQNDGKLGLKTDDWRVGVNAFAGLRFYLARNWAAFAEGRFTGLTRFKFKETSNLDGFNGDYDAIHALVGIGYHF